MQIDIPEISSKEIGLWNRLKKKHANALLLVESNDYYFALGNDAKEIAELPESKISFDEKREIVFIPALLMTDCIMPKLIKRGFRVVMCDQL